MFKVRITNAHRNMQNFNNLLKCTNAEKWKISESTEMHKTMYRNMKNTNAHKKNYEKSKHEETQHQITIEEIKKIKTTNAPKSLFLVVDLFLNYNIPNSEEIEPMK